MCFLGEKENSPITYFNMQMPSKVISFTLNGLLPIYFHGPPDTANEHVIQNKIAWLYTQANKIRIIKLFKHRKNMKDFLDYNLCVYISYII